MTDLRSQLRAYGRQIESELTAASGHTQEAPLLVLEPESPRPRRPLTYGLVAALLITVVAVPLVLTRRNPLPVAATTPTPELSNGWVAFSGAETEGHDIFIVREGDSPRRIIGFEGDGLDQSCPTFSPDGSKIAYIESDRTGLPPGAVGGGAAQVVIVEFNDNAAPLELFRGEATWRGCPTWSPDSTRVAYVFDNQMGVLTESSTVSQWLLNIVTVDGEVTTLFEGFGGHVDIEWSPDGSAIAVAGTFRNQGEMVPLWLSRIRLVAVDGSEPQELMQHWGSLSWAPDGSRLAALDQGMIEVAGLDGSHSSIPIGMSNDFDTVDWSPDGTRLAYLHRPEGRLTLVNPDGTEPVRLSVEVYGERRAAGHGPVWSPDGTQLLVAVGGLGNGAAIVSRSVEPSTPTTVLQSREAGMSDIFGMSWQPVFP